MKTNNNFEEKILISYDIRVYTSALGLKNKFIYDTYTPY